MDLGEKNGSIIFDIRVVPRASRSEIVGEHGGGLKVRIASPPVAGAANADLIRILAKYFGVAKKDIEIVGGQTSKNKRIKIVNLSQSEFEEKIK